jgi:hypothetical protein
LIAFDGEMGIAVIFGIRVNLHRKLKIDGLQFVRVTDNNHRLLQRSRFLTHSKMGECGYENERNCGQQVGAVRRREPTITLFSARPLHSLLGAHDSTHFLSFDVLRRPIWFQKVYPWAGTRSWRNRGKKPHKLRLRISPLWAGGLRSLELKHAEPNAIRPIPNSTSV